MNAFTIFAVLLFCGIVTARDERLTDDCLRGITDRNKCCSGVPDAWFAHLRNPDDCASFYQCDHGKPVWKACAAGTHWSVEADKCDWPNEAKCVVGNNNTTHNNGSKLPEGCYNGNIDVNTCCDGVNDWWVHLPDPNNCGKFYQCDNGKAVHKDCPGGLHWSVSADRCEWPNVAGCSEDNTTNITTTPAPHVDICEPEPVCHQCLTGIFPVDLCCRDSKTYHKLHLADANDCNSYYQCKDGHAIHRQCPKGLHWSVDSDRCEWPDVAKCVGNGNGTNENNDVSNDCFSGKISAEVCCENVPYWKDVLLQNNADCHTYIQCVHGKPMVRPCPANLWWSITMNRCEWKENATCTW